MPFVGDGADAGACACGLCCAESVVCTFVVGEKAALVATFTVLAAAEEVGDGLG